MTTLNEQDVRFQDLLALARAGSREAVGDLLWGCLKELQAAIAAAVPASQRRWWSGLSDVTQEVYLRAVRYLPTFRGTSRGELMVWLKEIRRTICSNLDRHNEPGGTENPRREVPLDTSSQEPPAPCQDPANNLIRTEQEEFYRWALRQLSEEDQEGLRLCYAERCTDNQIAEVLGCTPGAAAKRRSRAMRELRELREGREWRERLA